jgi:hypothetical protein
MDRLWFCCFLLFCFHIIFVFENNFKIKALSGGGLLDLLRFLLFHCIPMKFLTMFRKFPIWSTTCSPQHLTLFHMLCPKLPSCKLYEWGSRLAFIDFYVWSENFCIVEGLKFQKICWW